MVDVGIGTYLSEQPSARFPVYTRGNAGEVWPEVAYPLTISLSRGVGDDAFLRPSLDTGLVRPADVVDGPVCFGGVFGGYMYLNVSINRMTAIRTPGLTIEEADATFLGTETAAPPHRHHPDDRNRRASAAGVGWLLRTLRTREIEFLAADRRLVDEWRRRVPELIVADDDALVATMRELIGPTMELFAHHLDVTIRAGAMVQMLAGLCEDRLGDRSLALRLLGGLGDVDSAAPSYALWHLGRLVADDAQLTAVFDAGLDGLLVRLRADSAAGDFVASLDEFLDRFGARGPNEWESACETWGTDPSMPLALVDRMRRAGPDHDPSLRRVALVGDRAAALAEARSRLRRPVRAIFDRTLRAAMLFSQSRERSKTTVVDLIHVARLVARELARRLAQQTGGQLTDLWFVLDSELDDYVRDPSGFVDLVADRRRVRDELSKREPPFVFEGQIPLADTWPLRADLDVPVPAVSGEVLSGLGGCAGVAEGRARVVTDPADPGDLGPGDVLVAPLTDPSWTPLFVPVEAVVVDVGGQMSHAVIVSRELGRPCVVAVTGATGRIPDGTRVRVDGTAGTVTVLGDG